MTQTTQLKHAIEQAFRLDRRLISVRHGTGTARDWIQVKVPADYVSRVDAYIDANADKFGIGKWLDGESPSNQMYLKASVRSL